MTTVFRPARRHEHRQRMIDAGYMSVVHVPILFGIRNGRNGWYLPEMNRYLRERALLEWRPGGELRKHVAGEEDSEARYPTAISMMNYAERLANFNDWCDWSGRDWHTILYTEDIVQGYQADMEAGRWSQDKRRLAPATVNARVDVAVDFLLFAAARGMRAPFRIKSSPVRANIPNANHSHGDEPKVVEARAGRRRINPGVLRLPKNEEIKKWMDEVLARRGETKALMCDLILGAALRLEEAAQWRVDTLPLKREDWNVIGDKVRIKLEYGTKGSKTPGPDGEQLGPSRRISIPLALANRLHDYREGIRLKALTVWKKKHPKHKNDKEQVPDPVHLFLSEATGEPVSRRRLYEAWHAMENLPFKGWSPQLGRHWWACTTLLKEMQREAAQIKALLEQMPHMWVNTTGQTLIDTVIRPQLGHIHSTTSETYLQWVMHALALTDMYIRYHESLEEDDDNA